MEKPQIFLSYANEDFAAVHDVYQLLKRHNLNVWMDKTSIQPGMHWPSEMNRQIQQSDTFIIFISESSRSKTGIIQQEIKDILQEIKKRPTERQSLIPLVIEGSDIPNIRDGSLALSDFHGVVLNQAADLHSLIRLLKGTPYKEAFSPHQHQIKMLRTELLRGKLKRVLGKLRDLVDKRDSDILNLLTLLEARFMDLKKKSMAGIISLEDERLETAQIRATILDILTSEESRLD